ncbi:hypothetical protein V8E51_016615 [Hyaloscypha variabilis]
MRAKPDPVTDDHIFIREWAASPDPNSRHAVVAGYDRRRRLNYRIIHQNLSGDPIRAPLISQNTPVTFESIIFRAPYQNQTAELIRGLLHPHLKMNKFSKIMIPYGDELVGQFMVVILVVALGIFR